MQHSDHKAFVVYIGNFEYPCGTAAGKRVAGNIKLFDHLRIETAVIDVSRFKRCDEVAVGFPFLRRSASHFSLQYPSSQSDWLRFYRAFKTVRHILEVEIGRRPDAIVVYGSPVVSLFGVLLTSYCRWNAITVIADCVDWISVKTRSVVFNVVKSADNALQKRIVNTMADGVICISTYLEKYYQSRGKKTVVIPPLSPILYCLATAPETPEGGMKLIYAGRPFRDDMQKNDGRSLKDRIDVVFEILQCMRSKGLKFSLKVFGFERSEWLQVMPSSAAVLNGLGNSVQFMGRASNQVVVDALCAADFSVLVRDNKRDSIAGFPTKVSESLSNGIPTLVSNVGDISEYVRQGENGFYAVAENMESHHAMFEKALSLPRSHVEEMKRICRQERTFDPNQFIEDMRLFLSDAAPLWAAQLVSLDT